MCPGARTELLGQGILVCFTQISLEIGHCTKKNYKSLEKAVLRRKKIVGSYGLSWWAVENNRRQSLHSGASYLSQGFEDNVLGSSPGWLADTEATYCPSRPSQLTWKNITKPCYR